MAETAATVDADVGQRGKPEEKKGRWRTMFALAFGYFIDQGEGQALSVLFPTLQAIWGLSYTQLGLIGTIRNILQSITAPLWGYAADRFPRKSVILFGTGLWGIWTLLCGFTQSFGQLLVLALYQRYRQEGEPFIPTYLRILAHGGAKSPEYILSEAGIDMASPEFWQGGFAVIADMIDQLQSLA